MLLVSSFYGTHGSRKKIISNAILGSRLIVAASADNVWESMRLRLMFTVMEKLSRLQSLILVTLLAPDAQALTGREFSRYVYVEYFGFKYTDFVQKKR
jgi:hypothetical protein